MCITASVGTSGANRTNDAKTIQVLLNFSRPTNLGTIAVDGVAGPATSAAIIEFQTRVMHAASPSGKIEPNDATLAELKRTVPAAFSQGHLQAIALEANVSVINRYFAPLDRHMSRQGINTSLRQAHFLAQVCHESDRLRTTEEFATGDAYEGRAVLGNTQPGDGRRFKGRGLIQLTGRFNYQAFGRALNRDFLTDPNPQLLATDPDIATQVACWFWNLRNLNGPADANDIATITRRINGGLNGFADRQALFARAQCIFNLA